MKELKQQETEVLDILEAMLDVCDLDNPGPMFAGQHVRRGICKIMDDDAVKLRQYIATRRAAPENKPLTIEHIRQMVGRPVYVESGTRLGNFYALVGDADGTEAALITTDTEHRLILRLADVASGEVKVYARCPE
jgi:hypothetical protein